MTTLAGQYDPAIEKVIGDDQVAPATTVDVLMAACSLPQRALTQPYASPAMIHEANSTTIGSRYLLAIGAPGAETVTVVLDRVQDPSAGALTAQSVTFDASTQNGAYTRLVSAVPPTVPLLPTARDAYVFTISSPSRSAVTDRFEVENCWGTLAMHLPVSDLDSL